MNNPADDTLRLIARAEKAEKELERYQLQDRLKTREINLLVPENRKLQADLELLKRQNAAIRQALESLRDGNHQGTPINKGCAAMALIENALTAYYDSH